MLFLAMTHSHLGKWLRVDLSLDEQGVVNWKGISFLNRFVLSNQYFEVTDEASVHYTYSQVFLNP